MCRQTFIAPLYGRQYTREVIKNNICRVRLSYTFNIENVPPLSSRRGDLLNFPEKKIYRENFNRLIRSHARKELFRELTEEFNGLTVERMIYSGRQNDNVERRFLLKKTLFKRAYSLITCVCVRLWRIREI